MALQITDIKDYPSKQAEKLQQHLLELDKQGKLLDYFKEQYQDLGAENSLANYILKNWETDGKKLYLEWTGVEVYKENKTLIKAACVRLSEISYGSQRYSLWKCSTCENEWVTQPNMRTSQNFRQGCPECAKKKIGEAGRKKGEPLSKWCDKQGTYGEQIRKEFAGRLADGTLISIESISRGSNIKVWWHCSNPECNHEWTAEVNSRTNSSRSSGCPECAKKRIAEASHLKGETLEHWCDTNGAYGAKLKSEFMGKLKDGTPIKINQISRAGRDEVWWKCSNPDCGYEWTAQVSHRTTSRKHGCPKCAGTQLITGTNDLETFCKKNEKFIYLLDEFQGITEDKRIIKASEISRASHTKVKWCCKECGYIWYATPNSRTSSHSGCPKCAGNSCITGVNDLETYCKENTKYLYLLDEFVGKDEDGNQIKASEIGKNHYKKIQWKCRKCHRIWSTTSICRLRSDGCPYCTPVGTSFPEQFIYHSLKQLFPDTLNRAKDPIKGFEYDIVIPELKLCIEYSGVNWHADKLDRDQAKADHCKANKINFLQIYAHRGDILDEQDSPIEDSYEKNQIIYKISRYKPQHIPKLQYIVEFILDTYAPKHSLKDIDFNLSEQEANKVMGKA